MSEKMRTCTRCGKTKPENEFYRVKYKGKEPKNTYTVCKTCTAIEQRRRYLLNTDPGNPAIEDIERLYEKHRAAGRSVPGETRRGASEIDNLVKQMLEED